MSESEARRPFEDPSLPTEEQIDDLLDRMTLEEKAGQLVGMPLGDFDRGRDVEEAKELIDEHKLGSVAPFGWGGAFYWTPEECAEVARELQEYARQESRLGIPLLFNADAVHGHAYVKGATTFPNGLGMAATWDTDLTERAGQVTGSELRATGIHQNYGPTCDVGRDPRWGRAHETYGESPYLVKELVGAEVTGLQGEYGTIGDDSVIATAKHFPAYGEPRRGEDAAPVEVSNSTLRRVFLPSFEAAIEADVGSVMPCYNSIDGEPVHGSRRFLTELLREELGFDGHVVSDWGGVDHLQEDHKVTPDSKASSRLTRNAGLDVISVGMGRHAEHTVELVEEGELSEAQIEESVRRVLRAKFDLGLFEGETADPETAESTLRDDDHVETSRESIRKSLTLLQNDGDVLPLDDPEEIFVGGPNADDLIAQIGGWSVMDEEEVPGKTIREGLETVTDAEISYERGAGIAEYDDVEAAAEKAAEADVAVVAVGEDWYIHEFGPQQDAGHPTGEFPTRTELELPDPQLELVQAIQETGTPTVGVLVTGRPLATPWMAEHLDALLMAYFPGSEGGEVLAEALLGEVEPAGRLPMSIPKSAGHLPSYFNYLRHPRPIGDDEHTDSYDPLFEFGHGLGYAEIETTDLALSESTIGPAESVEVDVTVENTGDRTSSEVVQLYVTDEWSTTVTPIRELKGFERVELDAGETVTVTLELTADELGVTGPEPPHHVEEGAFQLRVDEHEAELSVESSY
ncbi:glycoside hydrolase family 3 N-terminal domain-containing protein [Salinarchaeum laminariae]|uniref:glycoside hydrolase family 3 N-terminal domain-containing protein n=1 Tax=Salinarchaeum laminariae TaxID=869888 RepID=UPI0020BE1292|nr:glycoside hydrolase family 3 N-terminal domain-containing protein [Salinarchaeum laminariae]